VRVRRAFWSALALVAVGGVIAFAVEHADVPPRVLAPYVERRAAGHHPAADSAGQIVAEALMALDRGQRESRPLVPLPVTAPAARAQPRAPDSLVFVGSSEDARRAIERAEPGDEIVFAPGTYRFSGPAIHAGQPGTPTLPITVRADDARTVTLEFDMIEGFLVSAPYWSFENLTIRGVCARHSACEHAFHIVGEATHFVARHNTIIDFNAHFKINGSAGFYPDSGLIEGNVIRNATVRDTGNPVTPIDLVAASHWRIRGNRISDFAKAGSDRVSYGAFAKGGGVDNRFEQNVVVCERRLHHVPGQRVGISLGGGGTGGDACRNGRCITEQEAGVIASNLIASCSDDGIYLNRAAMSRIVHNTLVDTGGISARFGESSADVEGNLVDGLIRERAGATLHERDNIDTSAVELYLGLHPVRDFFFDALALDLRWRARPPRRDGVSVPPPDLCGAPRSLAPTLGAFEDIGRCRLADN
jgi:hypothetical protein